MGQSSSAERARELKEHLQELHNFDPKVTGLRDELLNLVKKRSSRLCAGQSNSCLADYDHCERDSQATGENRRVPLPNCRHCAPELAIFRDHVHNFHEKLKAYTSHHPPIWAEGEEARHKKHAEQLSSYASVRPASPLCSGG
jgi:predicted small metal-binding protein